MTEKAAIRKGDNVVIAVLLSPDRRAHILMIASGREEDCLRPAAKYVIDVLIEPIRKRKLGPKLTTALKQIDQAWRKLDDLRVLSLWAQFRPPKFAYVDVRYCRANQFYLPD